MPFKKNISVCVIDTQNFYNANNGKDKKFAFDFPHLSKKFEEYKKGLFF